MFLYGYGSMIRVTRDAKSLANSVRKSAKSKFNLDDVKYIFCVKCVHGRLSCLRISLIVYYECSVPPIMVFCLHLKETAITENYMGPIYVKRARHESASHKLRWRVRAISDCAWLWLIDTRKRRSEHFRDHERGTSGFPGDLSILTDRARTKVYLQLPLIQLIERGISTTHDGTQCRHTLCNLQ